MLGKIEGKRRRGKQRMRWSDSITNSMDMNLIKLGDSGGQRSLAGYSPWGQKELDTTEQLNDSNHRLTLRTLSFLLGHQEFCCVLGVAIFPLVPVPEGPEAQASLSTWVRRPHVVPCVDCARPLALARLLVGRGHEALARPQKSFTVGQILEWIAISSCRGSSWPRFQTRVSCGSCTGRKILLPPSTWESL